MVLFGNRQFVRTQRHRWITHWSPVFVGTVVDPDLKDGGEQPAHHGEAVLQRGAIQAAAAGGGTVGELAAEQIDSGDEFFQDVEPAAFDIPTLRLVPAVSCSAGGLCGRVLPEVLVEVFVFQDAENQRLIVLENGNKMAGTIHRMDLPKERLPASAIGRGFQSGLIPLAVERVEGDPLVEQDLIGVANRIKLLDFAHPTARSMKANRGGMLAAFDRQPFFVGFPLAAQVVNRLWRCGHGRCPWADWKRTFSAGRGS